MNLGSNIQFLRKQKRITQEQLAETMSVSRQTVSRWELDEVVPELDKLMALSDYFSCKLDALIRNNLSAQESIYSPVTIKHVPAFTMARYVMITPNPEADVNRYMTEWANKSGLLTLHPSAKQIGWDFPFVTSELQNRFGLRGYVSAYILPNGFQTDYPGVEYANQSEADYAMITISEPFVAAFERIPNGYKRIMEYLNANGFKHKPTDNVMSCFEYVYESNGMVYMDVFVHVDSVSKSEAFTSFSQ